MGFDAHSISSLGLSTALTFEGMNKPDMSPSDYYAALLNILETQDFDSIPLVDEYGGEIKKIAMRELDGQVRSVKILELDEVTLIPQSSSVIQCIFEVLSNSDNIVFLTDEYGVIHDVVTIGMLTNPVIEEYLILLNHRLSQVNSELKNTEFALKISEGLSQLDNLVYSESENQNYTYTSFRSIIENLQAVLKPISEDKNFQTIWNSTDYFVTPRKQEFEEGTAGFFAIHPFGAISEDRLNSRVEAIAFEAFSKANDWTSLLYKTKKGYEQILQYEASDSFKIVRKDCTIIQQNTTYEELLEVMNLDIHEPISVEFDNSKYPGIITVRDLIYSDFAKLVIMKASMKMETCVKDMIIYHYLGKKIPFRKWPSIARDPGNLKEIASVLEDEDIIKKKDEDMINSLRSTRNYFAHIGIDMERGTENDFLQVEGAFAFLYSGERYIIEFCEEALPNHHNRISISLGNILKFYKNLKAKKVDGVEVNSHYEDYKDVVNKLILMDGEITIEINNNYNFERLNMHKNTLAEICKPFKLIFRLNPRTMNSNSDKEELLKIQETKSILANSKYDPSVFKSNIRKEILTLFSDYEGILNKAVYTKFVVNEFENACNLGVTKSQLSEVFGWKSAGKYKTNSCVYLLECLDIKTTLTGDTIKLRQKKQKQRESPSEKLNSTTGKIHTKESKILSEQEKKGNLGNTIKQQIIIAFGINTESSINIEMVKYKLEVRQIINRVLNSEPKITKSEFAKILDEPKVKNYTSGNCLPLLEVLQIGYKLFDEDKMIKFERIYLEEE